MEAGYFNPLAKPYADDLVISSPRYVDIRKGILQIENKLTCIGLTLHKTRIKQFSSSWTKDHTTQTANSTHADDLVIASPRYVDIRKGILQIENNLTSIGLTLHKTRTDSIMKELSDVQNNEA
jgi:hypothetical protein